MDFQNPMFAPEEVERTSGDCGGNRGHEDNPGRKFMTNLPAVFSNEYRRQVLGTESLQTITRDTFVEYQQSRYQPQNTTSSIVGDVGLQDGGCPNQLLKMAVPSFLLRTMKHFIIEEPAEAVLHRESIRRTCCWGFPPRLLGTKSEYALDLLSIIMRRRSSRLQFPAACRMSLGIVSSIVAITGAWFMPLFMVEAVTEPELVEQEREP